MERAIITISESGKVNIPDSNIWMLFSELVVLFDVAAPTLKATIRAIHKSGVIAEHTQHCEVIPYTYWATLYNMDMIAALAFRINSYGAEKIRSELLYADEKRKYVISFRLQTLQWVCRDGIPTSR